MAQRFEENRSENQIFGRPYFAGDRNRLVVDKGFRLQLISIGIRLIRIGRFRLYVKTKRIIFDENLRHFQAFETLGVLLLDYD